MRAQQGLAAALAVVLPALLLIVVFQWLARPDSAALDTQMQSVRASLEKSPPDVIVLGNSIARANVDPARVSAATKTDGSPPRAVAKLAIGGTPPPVWFAMARNGVYEAGFDPKVIVVVSTLKTMFFARVTTTDEAQRLREIIGTEDADILRKATGRKWLWPPLERAAARRVDLRDRIVSRWAEVAVGSDVEGRPARERIDAATAAVFDADGAVDLDLFQRVIPVLQDPNALAHVERDTPIEETFLPDLAQLARDHEARLVLVRVPVSRSKPHADSDARLGELIAWANTEGVGYVDLSELDVQERHFRDGEHLNAKGAEIFSKALGQALIELGVFGEGPMAPAEAPLPDAAVSRASDPTVLDPVPAGAGAADEGCLRKLPRPDLAPYAESALSKQALWNVSPLRFRVGDEVLGQVSRASLLKECRGLAVIGSDLFIAGIDGPIQPFLDPAPVQVSDKGREAAWVLPGGPLALNPGPERAERWGAEPLQVEIVAQLVDKEGPPVFLQVGEESWPIAKRDGRLVTMVQTLPGLPAQLLLHSEQAAVVRLVRILRGDEDEILLGAPEQAGESIVRVYDEGSKNASFAGPPPALPTTRPTREGQDLVWKVPELKHMNASKVAKASEKFNCSPVVVTLDGAPVEQRQEGCRNVDKPGEMCHDGKQVRYRPPAEAPAEPDRYALGLDPGRLCRRWTFVHPGDVLTVDVPAKAMTQALAGLEQLELTAVPLPRESDAKDQVYWTVEVTSAGKRLLQRELRLKDLDDGLLRAPVKRFAKRDGLQLVLSSTPGSPPLMLGYVVLHETPQGRDERPTEAAP